MPTHSDENFEAFLHIVHVSDMHCKGPAAAADVVTQRIVRRTAKTLRRCGGAKLANHLEERWKNGLAGHDPLAHKEMCAFLDTFANSSEFGGVKTWLLDTGDLSSLGDPRSLQIALNWLRDYERILDAEQTLVIHGNHDAWPGMFPLFATNSQLQGQPATLAGLIRGRWPDVSVSTAIPHSNAKFHLSTIDSTIADRFQNTLARGYVNLDPARLPNEFFAMDKRMQKYFHPGGQQRDFRVLALHHPVHYPPPRPTFQMSLRNESATADALAKFTEHNHGKLAHLLLSGHTHETYPSNGALPKNSAGQQYHPLYEGHIQLIAGSLSQLSVESAAEHTPDEEFCPQQFQILTFFAAPGRPQQLLMERRIVGRATSGPYGFLPPPGQKGGVESILFEY